MSWSFSRLCNLMTAVLLLWGVRCQLTSQPCDSEVPARGPTNVQSPGDRKVDGLVRAKPLSPVISAGAAAKPPTGAFKFAGLALGSGAARQASSGAASDRAASSLRTPYFEQLTRRKPSKMSTVEDVMLAAMLVAMRVVDLQVAAWEDPGKSKSIRVW